MHQLASDFPAARQTAAPAGSHPAGSHPGDSPALPDLRLFLLLHRSEFRREELAPSWVALALAFADALVSHAARPNTKRTFLPAPSCPRAERSWPLCPAENRRAARHRIADSDLDRRSHRAPRRSTSRQHWEPAHTSTEELPVAAEAARFHAVDTFSAADRPADMAESTYRCMEDRANRPVHVADMDSSHARLSCRGRKATAARAWAAAASAAVAVLARVRATAAILRRRCVRVCDTVEPPALFPEAAGDARCRRHAAVATRVRLFAE